MFLVRRNLWMIAIVFGVHLAFSFSAKACQWVDTRDNLHITEGYCTIDDISESASLELDGRIALVHSTIHIGRGATLLIDNAQIDELHLLSTPEFNAHIIADAATLIIRGIRLRSHDPIAGGPDINMEDGRSFIRVDAYVDDLGSVANGRLEIEESEISYLGYDARFVDLGTYSSYGLSLKVRSEQDLNQATITGYILNSTLSHNYRGFYSYGATDFEIRNNEIHSNSDYGVDGHDDTHRLVVENNNVFSNGGTGIICSRRCHENVFSFNTVHGNGANGIVLHDVSLRGQILNNTVYENAQDGIVIHDSHNTLVSGNELRGNRYGIRLFAGTTLTSVSDNRFISNDVADIFSTAGNLGAASDLSDLSHGPDWNGQNIARHNSSRVWGTEISGNVFENPARVVVREARYLVLSNNEYRAGVQFDIRESENVELDGDNSGGPVSYVLRTRPASSGIYTISAPQGAELSMSARDRVRLAAQPILMPQGYDFQLLLSDDEPAEVTVSVDDDAAIRTGTLIRIPLVPISGSGTISRYRDTFLQNRSVAMRILTDPDGALELRAFEHLCAEVIWTLNEQDHFATGNDDFQITAHQVAPLSVRCVSIASD